MNASQRCCLSVGALGFAVVVAVGSARAAAPTKADATCLNKVVSKAIQKYQKETLKILNKCREKLASPAQGVCPAAEDQAALTAAQQALQTAIAKPQCADFDPVRALDYAGCAGGAACPVDADTSAAGYMACLACSTTTTTDAIARAQNSGACGNGQVDAGEGCDGASDTACPGRCLADCQCAPPTICGNGEIDLGEECDGAALGSCPASSSCFAPGATDTLSGDSIECTCAPDHCDAIDVATGGTNQSGTFLTMSTGAPRTGVTYCGGGVPTTCVGGSNPDDRCIDDTDCSGGSCLRVKGLVPCGGGTCVGGDNDGGACDYNGDCPSGACTSEGDCGGCPGSPDCTPSSPTTGQCKPIPFLGVSSFEPFPIQSVSTAFTADLSNSKCEHQATVPCGDLLDPCPGTPGLAEDAPCCASPGFSVATFFIPALGFCSRVDQTACGSGVVDMSVPMLGDNDVAKRADTTAPTGPGCTYAGTESHGPCSTSCTAMACVGGGNNDLPCTGDGDCPGGSCESNAQSCDKLGQIIATIGDGTFDADGGNTRFRIPQRSTTWLETNPADASCDPTDTFDPGEIQITRFDLVLEPTTGKSSSQYVDSPDDADDLAVCGAGPAFPFQTEGAPDRPGTGAIVAATGTALSGGGPLYDLMYSSLTPLTSPVKVADVPKCTPPPKGCPE